MQSYLLNKQVPILPAAAAASLTLFRLYHPLYATTCALRTCVPTQLPASTPEIEKISQAI